MSTEANNEKKGLGNFFSEVRVELKKVHWPTKKVLFNHAGTVLITVAVISTLIYFIDSGLAFIMGKFLG